MFKQTEQKYRLWNPRYHSFSQQKKWRLSKASKASSAQPWLHPEFTWGALKLLLPGIHLQRSSLNWSGVQPRQQDSNMQVRRGARGLQAGIKIATYSSGSQSQCFLPPPHLQAVRDVPTFISFKFYHFIFDLTQTEFSFNLPRNRGKEDYYWYYQYYYSQDCRGIQQQPQITKCGSGREGISGQCFQPQSLYHLCCFSQQWS